MKRVREGMKMQVRHWLSQSLLSEISDRQIGCLGARDAYSYCSSDWRTASRDSCTCCRPSRITMTDREFW
jgi:hypothetical protein